CGTYARASLNNDDVYEVFFIDCTDTPVLPFPPPGA
ncbi:MAG: hypothetical protein ACI9OJ_005658, partial [Myxococcota bacterium]